MNASGLSLYVPLAARARMTRLIEGLLYLKNGLLEAGHSGFKVELGVSQSFSASRAVELTLNPTGIGGRDEYVI